MNKPELIIEAKQNFVGRTNQKARQSTKRPKDYRSRSF